MSFLAAMVGPKIASAAAQRALEVLAEEDEAAAAAVAAEAEAGGGQGDGGDVAMAGAGAPKNGENGPADGVSAAWEEYRCVSATHPARLPHHRCSPTAHPCFARVLRRPPQAWPPHARVQPIPAARARLAAATGLAAAAVQAKLQADQEEREVQRLVLAAIEHQFKKVHAKLQVRTACWVVVRAGHAL